MGTMTLILGGARGGKSSYAQRLAQERGGQVAYLATAQGLDEEMTQRIAAHQAERPAAWRTLEIPYGTAEALRGKQLRVDVVILDCVTLLISNVLMQSAGDETHPDQAAARRAVEAEITQLLEVIRSGHAEWIMVSNEVGMGLVPDNPLGRLYRDLLGWANQQLAAAAQEVYLMAAGIPVPIHQYRPRG
jgi:adenosylcobinamide kinase/adenosylcobinamide-phosphate guanylyltransferase